MGQVEGEREIVFNSLRGKELGGGGGEEKVGSGRGVYGFADGCVIFLLLNGCVVGGYEHMLIVSRLSWLVVRN